MKVRHAIYEKDQAVFRGPEGCGYVTQVQRSGGHWVAYAGDPIAPCTFGNFVRTIEVEEPDGPAGT